MAKRGRKPGSKNKRSSRSDSKKNIYVAILIILSLLTAVLIYGKAGSAGARLDPILGGIFGWIKNLIPIGLFGVAISGACDNRRLTRMKLFELVIFLICLSAIFSTFQISNNVLLNFNTNEQCN